MSNQSPNQDIQNSTQGNAVSDSLIGPNITNNLSQMIAAPKKKYEGGKIIATILGLVVLVGGIGAGVLLILQPQIFKPKASGRCIDNAHCAAGMIAAKNSAPGPVYQNPVTGTTTNIGDVNGVVSVNTSGQILDTNGNPILDANGNPITAPTSSTTAHTTGTDGVSSSCNPTSGANCSQGSGDYLMPPGYTAADGTPQSVLSVGTINSYDPNSTLPYVSGGYTLNQVLNSNTTAGSNKAGAYCPTGSCTQETDTNVAGYYISNGAYYPVGYTNTGVKTTTTNSVTPTPTPGPTAVCSNITAYSSTWAVLTTAQLSALIPGTMVNFCAAMSATGGTFDGAKFTINGTVEAETTTKRPGSNDYCQSYTILSTDTTLKVSTQVHNTVLGWF